MLIFLYGQDTFRSRHKLHELVEKFRREVDPAGMNIQTLPAAKLEAGEFRAAATASPFMAKKRLVVVENLLQTKRAKLQAAMLETLRDLSHDELVLIFWDEWQPEKISKRGTTPAQQLFTLLAEQRYAQEFRPLTPMEMASWVAEQVQLRGGKIVAQAARLLADCVGADSWRAHSEMEKLLAFAGKLPITPAMVTELVEPPTYSR